MKVTYEQALQEWGARKIEQERERDRESGWGQRLPRLSIDRDSVSVAFIHEQEYGGCPTCVGDSPSAAYVEIRGRDPFEDGGWDGLWEETRIDPGDFDFGAVLAEIVAIAEEKETA